MIPTKGNSSDPWAVTEVFSFCFGWFYILKCSWTAFVTKVFKMKKSKIIFLSLLSIDQYQVFRKPSTYIKK